MNRNSLLLVLSFVGVGTTAATALAVNPHGQVEPATPKGIRTNALVYVEEGPVERTTLHADGSQVESPTQWVTRPMCGSDTRNVTKADLARWRRLQIQEFAPGAQITVLDTPRARGVGSNFVFNLSPSVPAAAATAIGEIEAYLENQWVDPVTIEINVSFASMGGGVLGATSSNYLLATYTAVRAGLVGGMDPDDTIQNFLPVGATIPVRFDGSTGVVTNVSQVYVTRGNYNAAIGTASGVVANMTYNLDFGFDFTPANGINPGNYCFESVAVHEVGHAMGFTSGADFRAADIELLDLFRFQNTDGAGDYNPDDTTEFGTTPRTVDYNVPDDDAISDVISNEYRMSDGTPYQASHFREQVPNIGIMDPAFSAAVTFSPNFYRGADRTMFDAMGWDNTNLPPDVTPPDPDPMTFEVGPTALGTDSINMIATGAIDDTPPVQYMFQCTSATPGGTSSFWQLGVSYTDSGLVANTPYSYQLASRDSALPTPNQTAFSSPVTASTAIETPVGLSTGILGLDTVELVAQGSFTNLTAGASGLYFESLTPGGGGGINAWVQSTMVTVTGLMPDTDYEFQVKARNQDGVETAYGEPLVIHTYYMPGDCNNDLEFSVESDLDCIVDAMLGLETSPPGGAHRIDLNYDEITDGQDLPLIIECLRFGGC